jgi:hypothetical protein
MAKVTYSLGKKGFYHFTFISHNQMEKTLRMGKKKAEKDVKE